tara:strand:+ start:295 stop:528 length:234 start_codon:yes stop_codon:yes gene_type:complete
MDTETKLIQTFGDFKSQADPKNDNSGENGVAIVQFNLGVSYENGQGVAKDVYKAVRLFHLAATQGHDKAQNTLNDIN